MFAVHSLKSGLFHLIGQPDSQKGRTAKVKYGVISSTKFSGTISVDRYAFVMFAERFLSQASNSLEFERAGERTRDLFFFFHFTVESQPNQLVVVSAFQPQPYKRDGIFYQVQCTLFYIENNAKIFPAHYTWKVAEKGFLDCFYDE